MPEYILAIDQGTTSSRAVIFDDRFNAVSTAQKEFEQIYPEPGWVEHDPIAIWASQSGVIREAMELGSIDVSDIRAVGITNQRETTVVWDRHTGKPVFNAIVWQCRRTADICDAIDEDMKVYIRENTGLVVDAYFSATKVKWILDNVDGAREAAIRGDLLFGTIDTWLIWNLTKGKVHCTDYTNASRTMMYNINTLRWDEKILDYFDIPKSMLPELVDSAGIMGYTDISVLGREIPISGCAGDQQASLFGQACFGEGDAKNTYGTGCFLLMNTGSERVYSTNGLVSTIAWGINGKITYALEGSIFMGGAVIQWIRDGLRIIDDASQSEDAASSVDSNGGVYLVPAFTGLGAPYWDMHARGIIAGLTRGSTREHIIRAALESICYQTADVLAAMRDDANRDITMLKTDGGASANNFLMGFQADLLNVRLQRAKNKESTAMGAYLLAAIGVGMFKDLDEISANIIYDREFVPCSDRSNYDIWYEKWHRAVDKCMEQN